MSYQFKLEALRKYRRFQEDIMKKALTQAQLLRDEEIRHLEVLMKKRKQTEEHLKQAQKMSTNGPHMALFDSYLQRLSNEMEAQRQKVEAAERRCKEKMEQLLTAMQHRKTIDKLKEKDFYAYIENLNQNEQKFLNEIAINQFSRNQM